MRDHGEGQAGRLDGWGIGVAGFRLLLLRTSPAAAASERQHGAAEEQRPRGALFGV